MKFVADFYDDISSASAFVAECEADFEERLKTAASVVASTEGLKFISLAGPTCSGKTTTAKKLTSELMLRGKIAKVISIDDFYRDFSSDSFDKDTDFESASAIDLDCLAKCVKALQNGSPAVLPKYDFIARRRSDVITFLPKEEDVYIFEGIQSVYPEVRAIIPKSNSREIFVSVFDGICAGKVEFTKNEVRLIRRVVRDYNFRNTEAAETALLWEKVRSNEESNIFPNIAEHAVCVDSLMPYEIYLMRDIFIALAEGVNDCGGRFESISDVRDKMLNVKKTAVAFGMLPEHSFYREFVG